MRILPDEERLQMLAGLEDSRREVEQQIQVMLCANDAGSSTVCRVLLHRSCTERWSTAYLFHL